MPKYGKGAKRNALKKEKRQKAENRKEQRSKRTDKEQLALLDSKGYKAERERARLEKR